MDTIESIALSAVLLFLGAAITRVGIVGQNLGTFKLVSFVRKYPEPPRWYHRVVTVGIGVISILVGTLAMAVAFGADWVAPFML